MKLVVIGIDGMDFNLVNKWIDKLPTFKSLKPQRLESVVPTLSCPSWPCMFTGMGPPQLGMYDFVDFTTGRVFNSTDWWGKSIFAEFDRLGVKQELINVPIAYPPHKLEHGHLVPGQLGNPKAIPVDISHPGLEEQNLDSLLKLLMDEVNFVASALNRCLPSDLVFGCLYPLDPIQHYFWKYMDTSSKYKDEVFDFYDRLDVIIEEMVKDTEGTPLIVVSDHGFGPYYNGFNINKWLEREGYLKFKKPHKISFISRTKPILSKIPEPVKRKIAFMAPKGLRTRDELRDMVTGLYELIDWDHTVAYSPSMSSGCIFTHPEGNIELAEELLSKLRKLGMGSVTAFEMGCPELLVLPTNGSYPMNSWDSRGIWTTSKGWSGSHTLDGVFMSNIKGLECKKVTDVAGVMRSLVK